MSDRPENSPEETTVETNRREETGAKNPRLTGLESWTDLLNLDRLLELANQVESLQEKLQERGGSVTHEVRIRSSIPPRGNIPRSARASGFGPTVTQPPKAQAPSPGSGQSSQAEESLPERVGGLGAIAQQLRDYIEVPLKRPDVLQQLGLEPPKGVLLVGPPGTGKTLVARSLAATLGVSYVSLVGPEILSKYYGEAEAKLREVFAQAARRLPV